MGRDEEVREALAAHVAAMARYDKALADTFHPIDEAEQHVAAERTSDELAALWREVVATREQLLHLRAY